MRPLVALLLLASCGSEPAPVAPASDAAVDVVEVAVDSADTAPEPPRILSAFFGLDNALPATIAAICPAGPGKDGMPVVFSQRLLTVTPPIGAFRITTRSGAQRTPLCATLAPAIAPTERHTVLLVGDFGDEPTDPPVRVDIVASLPVEGGADAQGLGVDVVPLAAGPSLVLAMRHRPDQLPTSACPSPATRQILQITWNGGVSAPDGAAVGDRERARMHVTTASGEVVPDALGDLGDNDNYLHLCLASDQAPTAVRIEAGTFVDPRGDLNGETRVAVIEAR